MTAMPQPTAIPTMEPTERASPWLLLSLSAFDVDEMMGDAGEPGLVVDEVGDGEDTVLVSVRDWLRVFWPVVLGIEVDVEKAVVMSGSCSKRGGQPMGMWAQGSIRQQPA